MRCILCGNEATLFEVCANGKSVWMSEYTHSTVRCWCEPCVKIIRNSLPLEDPHFEKVEGLLETPRSRVRKVILSNYGLEKKGPLLSEIKKRFPTFSMQGLCSVAFVVIAIADARRVLDDKDFRMRKIDKGIALTEQESMKTRIEKIQPIIFEVPLLPEASFVEFVKRKTDWSLKRKDSYYSIDEISNEYFANMNDL